MTAAAAGSEEEAPDRAPAAWHSLPAGDALAALDSSPGGLDDGEAARRLARYGPNRLRAPARVGALRILADQFTGVVVLLLVAAAGVALLLGDLLEAAAIGAVLVLNAGIGFAVELRARRTMEALLAFEVPEATVVRAGEARRIPADALVPGDVVQVEEGEAVPADLRILEAAGVRVSEASLTGESAPVDKRSGPPVDRETPLAERATVLHAGTTVSVGRARALVVATGMDTQLGRIGRLVEAVQEERTPLEGKLDVLGGRLVGVALAVGALVVGVGTLRGEALGRLLETGLALAIAAVPEGLPAVATIALAVGLRRMARRNALVRKLPAVEALGSTTVVCTDKTGTLTAGEMTVTRVVAPGVDARIAGAGFEARGEWTLDGEAADPASHPVLVRVARAAALASRATVEEGRLVSGDPTDAALLVLARKAGVEREALLEELPPDGEIPFSSERRFSASFHLSGGGRVVLAKGAPAALLERSGRYASAGGERPLTPGDRRDLEERNEAMARAGLRVIGLATGPAGRDDEDLPGDLVFLALLGLADPPADGVEETIARLRAAGIRTVMITGDQRATAAAVATGLGILEEEGAVLDGRDLATLDDAALRRRVGEVGAYSRVSPEEKLRIVEALRDRGHVVAMLGDGVNDAAALKRAHVGVAMGGRGTDAARETAAVVLRDDRFPTVAAAVEEGRVIFDNIRKFVFYLFGCNLAEVLVLLGAGAAGLPLALQPLQILWLNLVTDTFPALALAVEPGEADVMRRPPRDPEAALLSRRFLGSLVFFAALIAAVSLGGFLWGLSTGSRERAVTLCFATLALAQLFHLGNARSREPVLAPRRAFANRWALGAVALVIGLQALAVHLPPLAAVLGTVPLGAREWGVVLALSAIPGVVGQALEWLQARR